MKQISLAEAADILETAEIEHSRDLGSCVVHVGVKECGSRFIMLNNALGETVVGEFK